MKKTVRILLLAGVVSALALVLAGASGADNQVSVPDPTGDNEGGLASDITNVQVQSYDDGTVTFKVSLNDSGGHFFAGDELNIFIDNDGDQTTGNQGFEVDLVEKGPTSSASFLLCEYVPRTSCSSFQADEATDVPTGGNGHVVTFNLLTSNWFNINFFVTERYTNSSGQSYNDFAPNTGLIRYDVRSDPDADNVSGDADKCPTIPGGRFDSNHDGCPSKLPVPLFSYSGSKSGSYVSYSRMTMTNASRASVTVKFPGFTARRRGSGPLAGITSRRFRVGSRVTFIYSSPNYFGRVKVSRITSGGGFATVRTACTLPGKTKIIACPKTS